MIFNREVSALLKSIILMYGPNGIPIGSIESEIKNMCGHDWKSFNCGKLMDYLIQSPDIYVVRDQFDKEVVITTSDKVTHLKKLMKHSKSSNNIRKNNNNNYYYNKNYRYAEKYNNYNNFNDYNNFNNYNCSNEYNNKNISDSHVHGSSYTHDYDSLRAIERGTIMEKLESLLPIIYKHQAIGDDIFVDLAENKLGYYVHDKKIGLCECGNTIKNLTQKVQDAEDLAPRVVVCAGASDLRANKNINQMIADMRSLLCELKKKKCKVTLMTIPPSPKIPKSQIHKMELFNKTLLDYEFDTEYPCNIIDINRIFKEERRSFQKNFDRLDKCAKNDTYGVLSDYGKKIVLKTLKICLNKQVLMGH